MPVSDFFKKVSQAPTNPHAQPQVKRFDVADLYKGPAEDAHATTTTARPLDEKLRQAYF